MFEATQMQLIEFGCWWCCHAAAVVSISADAVAKTASAQHIRSLRGAPARLSFRIILLFFGLKNALRERELPYF